MGRNMMIDTIKESVQNVVVPTISHDHALIAQELKAKFDKVRAHKESVFRIIIDEEVGWLTGYPELITSEVARAKTVDDLKKIRVYTSEKRQNELNEVIRMIYGITDLMLDGADIPKRTKEIEAIKNAMNGTISKLLTLYRNMYTDINSKVVKKGRDIQASSVRPSFGRYVRRVAKHSVSVPRRAWIA